MKELALLRFRHVPATVAVASLFAVALSGIILLPAAPAAAETTLEVATPADGRYQPGRATPVEVTVRSDEAVNGVISVVFEGMTGARQQIEVPGGSAKSVLLMVDTPPWNSGATVSFDAEGERSDSTARLALNSAAGDELVGVLPGLADRQLPETAALTVELGQARFYPIEPALLDLGIGGLAPFNQVLATAADLEELSPDQLDALQRWVSTDSGRLIIDESEGAPIPIDLDDVTADAGSGGYQYGLGQVAFSDGAAGSGDFDGLIPPTRSRSANDRMIGWGGSPTTILLAADAGVRIPAIEGLVLALVGYVALIGPVLWLVLRRGRREPLAWLAIPALAALATVGVYGVGRAMRQDEATAHATLVADLPATTLTITQVLASVPGGGSAGVTLPAGWRPSSSTVESPFDGGPATAVTTNQVVVGDQLVVDAPVGGVAVVSAEQVRDAVAPAWEADVAVEDGTLTGSVTNNTDVGLEEVLIVSGAGVQRVGTVGAGETVDVSVRNANQVPLQNDRMMQALFDSDPWSPNDNASNPSLLGNWVQNQPGLRDPGNVMVVGWTREAPGPLEATSGARAERGRTARLTVRPVESAAGRGQAVVLRGWESTRVIDVPNQNRCTDAQFAAHIASPGEADDGVALDIRPDAVAALDVWNGEEWVPGGMTDAAELDELVVALPPTSIVDGGVYLRMLLTCESWEDPAPLPVLRAARPGDPALAEPAEDTKPAEDDTPAEDSSVEDTPDEVDRPAGEDGVIEDAPAAAAGPTGDDDA